nr:carboxyl transferase domain-containing protein [Nocardioides daphniae]
MPTDLKEPFDPRDVIVRIVDGVSAGNEVPFDEFKPLYGSSLVTGWARLHGREIGILANAQGVLFSEEAQKATQFIRWPTPRTRRCSSCTTHRLHGRQGVRAGRHHQARCRDDQRGLQLDRPAPSPC